MGQRLNIFSAVVGVSLGCLAAENLIANAGMELGKTAAFPEGWRSSMSSGAKAEYIRDGIPGQNVYAGTHAVAIYEGRSPINGTAISGDNDWTQISVIGTAPDGAAFLRPTFLVKAAGSGPNAKVTFDDCQITSGSETGASVPAIIVGVLGVGLR